MPPPLEEMSDDESTGGSIPFDNNNNGNEQEEPKDAAEGQSGEEGEDEEGVYVVESVVGHEFAKKGTLLLQVKWKGYDDPADQTLEPEENLMEGAKDLVEEYYHIQGGRPQKPAPAPRKRKSTGPAKQTPEKTEPKKKRKSRGPSEIEAENDNEQDNADWLPEGRSWEKEVEKVDTICREPETNGLCAYLVWKNGKKSKVSVETCYDKCPKKMLQFYEQHLVFKQ